MPIADESKFLIDQPWLHLGNKPRKGIVRKDQVVFLDTETTGLDPDRHEIWEVALIDWDGEGWVEYQWFIKPERLEDADPIALDIGKYWERVPRNGSDAKWTDAQIVCNAIRALTWNKHLCGAIPSFDEERLRLMMYANGVPWKWHYHIIDIEAMSVGWILGKRPEIEIELPWKSEQLIDLIDPRSRITPTEKHTALGDARQVKAIFERIALWQR